MNAARTTISAGWMQRMPLANGTDFDLVPGGAGDARLPGIDSLDCISARESPVPARVDLAAARRTQAGTEPEHHNVAATLVGSQLADWLAGDAGADRICGFDGDDRIWGRAGDDLLRGGAGSDTLCGGAGEDELGGGDGADRLFGGAGDDTQDGGRGNDRLDGGSGFDAAVWATGDPFLGTATVWRDAEAIFLGTCNQVDRIVAIEELRFDAMPNPIDGPVAFAAIEALADANAVLRGTDASETIEGGDGRDVLIGVGGGDDLLGGGGDDWIRPGAVAGHFDGGDGGLDTIDCGDLGEVFGGDPITGRLSINLEAGDYRFTGFENACGSNGADAIQGSEAANRLLGLGGNDLIAGGGGGDVLEGGRGDDVLSLQGREQRGSSRVDGGPDFDSLTLAGRIERYLVTLDGDGLALIDSASTIRVRAVEQFVFDDRTLEFDELRPLALDADLQGGTPGADTMIGGEGRDVLIGRGGPDTLDGRGGDDRMDGGFGPFSEYPNRYGQTMLVDETVDTATYRWAPRAVTVDLRLEGIAQDTQGAGIDTLFAIEGVHGSAFDDTLIAGDDTAHLSGGGGNDVLYAFTENEDLTGGTGADRFVWRSTREASNAFRGSASGYDGYFSEDPVNFRDWVTDFDGTEDRIDLTGAGIAAADLVLERSDPESPPEFTTILLRTDTTFEIRVTIVAGALMVGENLLL